MFLSCNNKPGDNTSGSSNKNVLSWHDDIKPGEIPDSPLKGFINGREVQFQYINFEKWRGSGDNVINFSVSKPGQNCGYIEDFEGFTLMNKGGDLRQGDWKKARFTDDPATYKASFKAAGVSSSEPWNCALNIDSISDKVVKGRVVIFFNDEAKSWVAGKFEAIICNN